MTTDQEGAMVRVGEIARAAGLTVRALHHYEHIGLVAPSRRTDTGHRLYGPEAVARLYRVRRLRSLGMSLDQIRHALDEPNWSLDAALRRHLLSIDDHLAGLTALRHRVSAAISNLDHSNDPSHDLLEVLSTMESLANLIRRRISIMVYRDLRLAHDYLTEVFGFTPGDVTLDSHGDAVHAQVFAGDGVIWLHPETAEYRLASPQSVGAATATMAVLVDDVDEHHRFVSEKGGDIVYEPVDQPYGYREYSARDCEGALWSFMKELTP